MDLLHEMKKLGVRLEPSFDESWLDAQVDTWQCCILGHNEKSAVYTCGTLNKSGNRPGYEFKYRNGSTFTNRIFGEYGNIIQITNDAMEVISGFINGFARVNTPDNEEKLLIMGNYTLPTKCTSKVVDIYQDFHNYLKLIPSQDFPYDKNDPQQDSQYFTNAYRNVMMHGLVERYVELRRDFDNAKSQDEKEQIYLKTRSFVESYELLLDQIHNKTNKLMAGDDTSVFGESEKPMRYQEIMKKRNEEELAIENLKTIIEPLLEKTDLAPQDYDRLAGDGADMSDYNRLPTKREAQEMFTDEFDKIRAKYGYADFYSDTLARFIEVVLHSKLEQAPTFIEALKQVKAENFSYLNSQLYRSELLALHETLKYFEGLSKEFDRKEFLAKMYTFACFAAYDTIEHAGEDIATDLLMSAAAETILGLHDDNDFNPEDDDQPTI